MYRSFGTSVTFSLLIWKIVLQNIHYNFEIVQMTNFDGVSFLYFTMF